MVPSLWASSHHQILQDKPLAGEKLGPTLMQAEKDLNLFKAGSGSRPELPLSLTPVSGLTIVLPLAPEHKFLAGWAPWGTGDLGQGLMRR